MEQDKTMKELRAIRDENSHRHMGMTEEQCAEEFRIAREWFQKQITKPLNTYNTAPRKIRHAQ